MQIKFATLKILPLLLLFLFSVSPHTQVNLHLAFVHQHEVAHSHEANGTIHFHAQHQTMEDFAAHVAAQHQHAFVDQSLVFVRDNAVATSNVAGCSLAPIAMLFAPRNVLPNQLTRSFAAYLRPPEYARREWQDLIQSHPNTAPPLA